VEELLRPARSAGRRQYAGILQRDLDPLRVTAVGPVMSERGGGACTGLGIPVPT